MELERGYKLTKKDLLDFIDLLLKGDKNDKDYQKKIIDNLVSQVFVSDDDTVVYFNIRGGKSIETVSVEETQAAIKGIEWSLKIVNFSIRLSKKVTINS